MGLAAAFTVMDVISTRTRCGRRAQHWREYDLCGRGLHLGGGDNAVRGHCSWQNGCGLPLCRHGMYSDYLWHWALAWVWPTLASVVGTARVGASVSGRGLARAHLPDTRLLAVHHRHVAGLAVFDELLLRLIELLGHEAHEGVVWGVSYSPAAEREEGVVKRLSKQKPGPLTCLSQESQLSMWGEHPQVG